MIREKACAAPGTGQYLASALGVWDMLFLAVTLVGASLHLG